MKKPPQPEWWIDTYVSVAEKVELNDNYRPRGGEFTDYSGPLSRFLNRSVLPAFNEELPVREACQLWYSGAYLLETVPSVIYILMKHGDDPEQAIIRAVNDTKDNDTIAAIVGAAVGALHGRDSLPKRWLAGLSGRTEDDDDGRIFELITEAKRTFWESP